VSPVQRCEQLRASTAHSSVAPHCRIRAKQLLTQALADCADATSDTVNSAKAALITPRLKRIVILLCGIVTGLAGAQGH
jgi:hypothetical protein